MPGVGSPWGSSLKRLANLRCHRVNGFSKYLIFYVEKRKFLQVWRVMHQGQDLYGAFPIVADK